MRLPGFIRSLAVTALFAAAFCPLVPAEEIEVPGAGFVVSFDGPALENAQDAQRGTDYAYRAAKDRFSLSFFAEAPPQNGSPTATHQQCYDHYWLLARQNPTIKPNSAQVTPTEKYHRLEYSTITVLDEKRVESLHVHYYFVFAGKWMDLHLGILQPTNADREAVRKIDETLSYQKTGG